MTLRNGRVKPKLSTDVLAQEKALSYLLNCSRGIAALLVLFFHIRTTLAVPYEQLRTHTILARLLYTISTFGHDAVIIFFVLSGFLVGGAVLRIDMREREGVWHYGIDRAVRIAPVLFATTAFAVLLQHVDARAGCADMPTTIVGNAFAAQNLLVSPLCNNLPLWSISNEVAYYFMFPVIVAAISGQGGTRLAYLSGGVLLIVVLSLALTPLDDTNIVIDFPLWLIGAALWFFPEKTYRFGALALLALGAAFVFGRLDVAKANFWLRDIFLATAFATLLLTATNRTLPQAGILAVIVGHLVGAGRWLADISFSLYVTHYPLIRLYAYFALSHGGQEQRFTSVTPRFLLVFASLSVTCVLVAAIFSAVFERPRGFLKRALFRRLQPFGVQSKHDHKSL